MNRSLRLPIAIALLCAFLALSSCPAEAQTGGIGITNGQAAGIIAGFVAVVAGVSIIVYFAVRTPPTITGCAVSGANGLNLTNESNHQTFILLGETASIHPGDRVKIKGKRQKKDTAGNRSFLVSEIKKDYGACAAKVP
jgi:hypothetical protein